jgi:1-deoxyxylulose-5-phosphate synthase
MEITRLGRTGLKVSRLCLGTMTFGTQADEATAFAIMDRAWDAGVFFYDTADYYPVGPDRVAGATEEIVGRWVAARGVRDQLVLATKGRAPMGPGANDQGLSRRYLIRAVHASLRRLRTDWIDLYQLHWFDDDTPLDETLRALDDMLRQGLIHYIGCSNYEAWRLCKALWTSDVLKLARFDSVQPRYNALDRRIEAELLPLCADQGVGVLPYSPLGGGLLTGKYRPDGAAPAEARFVAWNRRDQLAQSLVAGAARLEELARARGLSLTRFALGWLLANPLVTAPIVGASRPDQLDETLAAVPLDLSDEERAVCDQVWRAVQPDVH